MSEAGEYMLDVRGLAPPEPFDRALEAVAGLQAGEYLRMLHNREPFPLYTALSEDGFDHRTRFCRDHFEIMIWRRADAAARDAALQALSTAG